MPAILTVTGTLKRVKVADSGKVAFFTIESPHAEGEGKMFQDGRTFNPQWIEYLSQAQIGSRCDNWTGEIRNTKTQKKDENGKAIYENAWIIS